MSQEKPRIRWKVVLFMGAMHIAAVPCAWFYLRSWEMLGLIAVLWYMTGCLGITGGFHRYFAHNALRVRKPLAYAMGLFGTLALQGPIKNWVGNHRAHHKFSDTKGDPHSPVAGPYRDHWWGRGFWWSHICWMFFSSQSANAHRAKDLDKDAFYRFLDRNHFRLQLAFLALLYFIGGFPYVAVGGIVRIVFVWHATWSINSITHMWGRRRFHAKGDESRNNALSALLSHGEGWHNNHHQFQNSARMGFRWYELDVTWLTIRLLKLVGLVTHVTDVSEEKMAAARIE